VLEQILLIVGAAIFGLLGTAHLGYTFFTDKFHTRDSAVGEAMKNTSPVLTGRTTVWRAWIGFNASHSLGAMTFAVFYLMLATQHMAVIRSAPGFAWLATINGLAYLALAKAYWFRTPFIGILIATICFLAAALRLKFA
jgi:hypothetical protein